MRVSIAVLAVMVAIASVFIVAAVHGAIAWIAITNNVVLLLVGVAAAKAIAFTDRRRVFWGGFAFVGWMYHSFVPLGAMSGLLLPAAQLLNDPNTIHTVPNMSPYSYGDREVSYTRAEILVFVLFHAFWLMLSYIGGWVAAFGIDGLRRTHDKS